MEVQRAGDIGRVLGEGLRGIGEGTAGKQRENLGIVEETRDTLEGT